MSPEKFGFYWYYDKNGFIRPKVVQLWQNPDDEFQADNLGLVKNLNGRWEKIKMPKWVKDYFNEK